MKELYIAPELEILCFLPVKGIAAEDAPYDVQLPQDDEASADESVPGEKIPGW